MPDALDTRIRIDFVNIFADSHGFSRALGPARIAVNTVFSNYQCHRN